MAAITGRELLVVQHQYVLLNEGLDELLVLLFVNGRLVEFSNGGIYFGEGGVVIGLRYFVDRRCRVERYYIFLQLLNSQLHWMHTLLIIIYLLFIPPITSTIHLILSHKIITINDLLIQRNSLDQILHKAILFIKVNILNQLLVYLYHIFYDV